MGRKNKSKRKKILLYIALVFVIASIAIGIFFWDAYKKAFSTNVKLVNESEYLFIPTGSDFDNLIEILENKNYLTDLESFKWVAEKKNYKGRVKPGKYKIKNGMSNNDFVNLLRSGAQEPIQITFNNIRTVEELAGKISEKIEADSISITALLQNSEYISDFGFNKYTIITLFIPNTYEFFWNTSAEGFVERMAKEYKNFWTSERKLKASNIGLSQSEVTTLASIVQMETRKNDEKNIVAGVYINRIKKRMKLQADPTVIFAIGDFSIKRVLKKHLSYDSPYNTYKYQGLPPGPIIIPDISSIDAVLNYKKHNYIFFCAKEDFSGYHNFAKTLREHNNNARKYQRALNKRKIYK